MVVHGFTTGSWVTLPSVPCKCRQQSQHVYACAASVPGSWAVAVGAALAQRLVPLPSASGLTAGSPSSARARFMRVEAVPRLAAQDLAFWRQGLLNSRDEALHAYAVLVQQPAISQMHCWRVSSQGAAAWAHIRGGSSCLPAQRIARHALCCATCTLCGSGEGDILHMLSSCPALSQARAVWWSRVSTTIDGSEGVIGCAASLLNCLFAASPQPPFLLAAHAAFAVAIESAFSRRR